MTGLGLAKYRSPEDAKQIETILAVSEGPDDDYNFFRSRWMPGTCEWILTEPAFAVWMRNTSTSRILWLNALPASGKSILSSFIINYLREAGVLCQFYYFRFGDQTKRSPNSFLRSVAFQLAQEVPAFKQALTELCGEGMRLGKADSRTIWQKLFKTALLKLDVMTPLYWVIDALDESDSPHLLLEILSNISCSKVPIRVFITSRQNPSIALAFERLASSTPVEIISAKHSTSDIRMYVETEIEFMRGDSEFKQRMTEKILERAGGNFLWVHLALKEVLECHFQDAAEQALEDVPAGMEPLYQRMEATMAKTSKGRDRELAKRLLTWAMCSRRSLDLEELSRALEPEFPAVLDMKHTISQVCGQFIVVDTKDRLMMIHQTAREYLTRTPNLTFSITPAETHEDLFTKCVTFLTGYGLRAKLGQNTSQPFLLYAATSWSYHLRSASAASDSVLTLLTKFLHGQYVLTWIYALALFGQLKELVYASQSLTTFVERRRKLDASRIPLFHRVQDSETLELWATDLVKVVGKFSENLMNKPDSIFRLIPQFCPRSSIIYRQFGRKESSPSALSVTGILNNVWDDRLAKVLVGTGCQAVHIACYGSYLAISTSAGSIILWDAVTFEEVRTLPHQEQISTMCFGTSSDKLVSYGFKTTKIWSISSGRQLYCFLNPTSSRALGIIFADNDMTVLIGSDDKIIRRASLKHVTPCWRFFDETVLKEETSLDGTYQNSPCCMIFNNDATQIAVAYRGFPLSVWGVDDSRLIGRCKRVTTRRSSIGNAWTGVDRVTWHPRTGDVLGVYNDGCVFRWHPFEDDGQEIYAAASEIQCSPDGTLFATSDVSGTIKLWNFQHFALIYRLACEYPVTALGFSPDCRRLYDLRGSSCNVWEPNALIRLSETDERGSENASETGSTIIASLASEADSEMLEPITALAASPKGSMYCAGNEDGLVELFDSTSGKVMELWRSRNFMTVDHLIWGQDGRHIASTEFGGTILVKAVDPPASHQRATDWSVRTALEGKVKVESGGIQQLLLSPTSTFLLVSSQGFAQIWSLERGSMVASCISKIPGSKSRWLNHPLYSDQLLEFNFSSVTSYRWEDLTELTTLSFDDIDMSTLDPEDEELPTTTRRPLGQAVPSPSDIHGSVHKALLTQASTHIIVETSRTSAKAQRTKRLRIFETSSFSYLSDVNLASTSTYISPSVLTSLPVSPAILARVVIPLGVLSKEKLVFLDKESWVCTYRLRSGDDASAVRQHFFLPRDWLNSESLELCRVMADGTFLCPRNGEVAVIRSSVGLDW